MRDHEGNINGKLNGRFLLSDILKGLLVLLLGTAILGGKDAYNWYQKNKDMPQKFEKHCIDQAAREEKLANVLGKLEQYMEDNRRRR